MKGETNCHRAKNRKVWFSKRMKQFLRWRKSRWWWNIYQILLPIQIEREDQGENQSEIDSWFWDCKTIVIDYNWLDGGCLHLYFQRGIVRVMKQRKQMKISQSKYTFSYAHMKIKAGQKVLQVYITSGYEKCKNVNDILQHLYEFTVRFSTLWIDHWRGFFVFLEILAESACTF